MKRQENRTVIAWRGAASAGLFSSADRAYMKAPVPRLTPDYETKCPRRIATLTKKQTDFSLKIEMGGEAILRLSRLDYPPAKIGGTVNGGAFVRRFILTVDWLGWICYFPR